MVFFNKQEQKYLRRIAKVYGCRVKFSNYPGGCHRGNGQIEIGWDSSKARLISVFCHELGHHLNTQNKKYPIFHSNLSVRSMIKKLGSFDRAVDYSLKAEIYTEKVGKELCGIWFPKIKYEGWYKNARYCRSFIMGLYINST